MGSLLVPRRRATVCIVAAVIILLIYFRSPVDVHRPQWLPSGSSGKSHVAPSKGKFQWSRVPVRYPVESITPLPAGALTKLPKIQTELEEETAGEKQERLLRLETIKKEFLHAWNGYKDHAWMSDEVMPVSGRTTNAFGGWAATLVDTLDTLWIMGLTEEFDNAVNALGNIDFSTSSLQEINVFETTIRYLGGFLAAYDLSGSKYPVLLEKAVELGEMLYIAFDTPNRMPITRWNWQRGGTGKPQEASHVVLVAEIGSLTLEFTRLSQVTGDPKYYDAIQRVMDVFDTQQSITKIPGLWPVVVNAKALNFTDGGSFTIGGMADSMYEYLPKQHVLLGGATQQYRKMYEESLKAMKKHIFYRPMSPNMDDVLLSGQTYSNGQIPLDELPTEPQAQHLGCFAGGMVGIGAKIFGQEDDVATALKLAEGCLWAYEIAPLGIMPEIIHTVPCLNPISCSWDEKRWHSHVEKNFEGPDSPQIKIDQHHLVPGIAKVDDGRYILRPEAIESIFILYRITGKKSLQDRAWKMFENIIKHTKTDIAHAALADCTITNPPKSDRMESFWTAETLKYFYLLYSDPSLVSLDEYVLNTEAHPLKTPR